MVNRAASTKGNVAFSCAWRAVDTSRHKSSECQCLTSPRVAAAALDCAPDPLDEAPPQAVTACVNKEAAAAGRGAPLIPASAETRRDGFVGFGGAAGGAEGAAARDLPLSVALPAAFLCVAPFAASASSLLPCKRTTTSFRAAVVGLVARRTH